MKIKALYLHNDGCKGLSEEKKEILKGFNLEIESPTIDYKNASVDDLINIYESTKPNLIIGSGMGGRVGYWMSNYFNTKSLLFNPAIGVKQYEEHLSIPDYFKLTRYSDQVFVFGGKHENINRKDVLKYTGNAFHEITIEDMGAKVSPNHFRRGVLEAVNYIL